MTAHESRWEIADGGRRGAGRRGLRRHAASEGTPVRHRRRRPLADRDGQPRAARRAGRQAAGAASGVRRPHRDTHPSGPRRPGHGAGGTPEGDRAGHRALTARAARRHRPASGSAPCPARGQGAAGGGRSTAARHTAHHARTPGGKLVGLLSRRAGGEGVL
ncbi:hypothetical protein LT493_30250 [Streptomyces tricolor]|nr:hypothetical protein [Streptomyces tricolor]